MFVSQFLFNINFSDHSWVTIRDIFCQCTSGLQRRGRHAGGSAHVYTVNYHLAAALNGPECWMTAFLAAQVRDPPTVGLHSKHNVVATTLVWRQKSGVRFPWQRHLIIQIIYKLVCRFYNRCQYKVYNLINDFFFSSTVNSLIREDHAYNNAQRFYCNLFNIIKIK